MFGDAAVSACTRLPLYSVLTFAHTHSMPTGEHHLCLNVYSVGTYPLRGVWFRSASTVSFLQRHGTTFGFTNHFVTRADRLQEMTYTTTVTSDTYLLSSYSCFPSEALIYSTSVEPASNILIPLESQTGTGISLPKITITRTTGPVQTVTQTVHELVRAAKHRRWKGPHGSPSHTHIKPSSKATVTDTTTSPISKDKDTSSTTSPTVTSSVIQTVHELVTAANHRRWKSPRGSPSHTHIEPSSKDMPMDTTTSAVTKDAPTFPNSKDKDTSSTTSPTTTSPASCTSLGPDATDTPASRDKDTGLLFRSSCGASDATVSECPYLCGQAGGGFFKQCSDEDVTGQSSSIYPPIICGHCLPPCKSDASNAPATTSKASTTSVLASPTATAACTVFNPFLEGDFPSVRDKVFDPPHRLLRFECGQTAELESECPYLCIITTRSTSTLPTTLSLCFDADISGPIPLCINSPDCSWFCEHCNASTIQPKPSSTCTSVDPAHPTCPPVINNNVDDPGVRYQTACGNTTESIAECPYLCTANSSVPNFHCEQSDVSGTFFDGSGPLQACHKCLPLCQSAV